MRVVPLTETLPLAGVVVVIPKLASRVSTSAMRSAMSMVCGASSFVVNEVGVAVGLSLTGTTVTETDAVEVAVPSEITQSKLSGPL